MKQICILCGKEAKIENFCEDCWLNKKTLFNINNFELKICKCNSWLEKNKWKGFKNLDELTRSIVESKIRTENKIFEKRTKLKRIGNKYLAEVECRGYILPSKKIKTEKKRILVKIKEVMCDRCKKLSGMYYEAVLQIRTKKDLRGILLSKKRYIVKINKIKNGYDVFILKKSVARDIAKELSSLNFNIKKSYKLLGEKNGKKVYRFYYSIKEGVSYRGKGQNTKR